MPEKIVGTVAIAEMAGVQPGTVAFWCRLRGMPCVRVGSRYLFDREQARAWIQEEGVKGAAVRRNRRLKAA